MHTGRNTVTAVTNCTYIYMQYLGYKSKVFKADGTNCGVAIVIP